MSVLSTRRYYLLKRLFLRRNCLEEDVWVGKQQAEPGVALPPEYPSLARLTELGYSTVEDLNGATSDELLDQGLTKREAAAVLAALAPLIA